MMEPLVLTKTKRLCPEGQHLFNDFHFCSNVWCNQLAAMDALERWEKHVKDCAICKNADDLIRRDV